MCGFRLHASAARSTVTKTTAFWRCGDFMRMSRVRKSRLNSGVAHFLSEVVAIILLFFTMLNRYFMVCFHWILLKHVKLSLCWHINKYEHTKWKAWLFRCSPFASCIPTDASRGMKISLNIRRYAWQAAKGWLLLCNGISTETNNIRNMAT